MTNVEVLTQAGVIKDAKHVSPDMAKKINALSPEEITHLISIKGKLGEDDLKGHGKVMII